MMPQRYRPRLLHAVALLAVFLPHTVANGDELWTHQLLFDNADLVVVATASAPQAMSNTDDFFPRFLQQLESELQIHAVFKGSTGKTTIQLVHFRYRDDVTHTLGNGPSFVGMGTEARSVAHGPPTKPHYLLFLRKRKDSRFEPVSGNRNPVDSVVRLLVFPELDPALKAN